MTLIKEDCLKAKTMDANPLRKERCMSDTLKIPI